MRGRGKLQAMLAAFSQRYNTAMDPVWLWLARVGAISLGALSGAWLANTTPTWREDRCNEEFHFGRRYRYNTINRAFQAGGCLENLIFPQRWNISGQWLPSLLKLLVVGGAIFLAMIGWPGSVDIQDDSMNQGDSSFLWLFETSNWVIIGSIATGYVAGILLRKPVK